MRRGEILLRYFRLGKPFVRVSKAPSRITVQCNITSRLQPSDWRLSDIFKQPPSCHQYGISYIILIYSIVLCTHRPAEGTQRTIVSTLCTSRSVRFRDEGARARLATRFLTRVRPSPWNDIKILGNCSVTVCLYVCLCVQSGTISKFWTVPLASKSV